MGQFFKAVLRQFLCPQEAFLKNPEACSGCGEPVSWAHTDKQKLFSYNGKPRWKLYQMCLVFIT
jgi:hypothetical protein